MHRIVWIGLLALAIAPASHGQIVSQYWDTAAADAIQGGDGAWNATDANWATNRRASMLAAWGDGNYAFYVTPSNGLASTVTLATTVSVGAVSIGGGPYTVIVTNGGLIANGMANSFIGDGGTGNAVIVTGAGSGWDLGGKSLYVGNRAGGVSNCLRVTQVGAVSKLGLYVGGTAGGTGNRVLLDGGTMSQASNLNVSVGEGSSGNAMVLANGARFTRLGGFAAEQSPAATVVGKSHNNLIRVETHCVWDNGSGLLYVGNVTGATNNRVVIDGGVFTNIGGKQRVSIGGEGGAAMSGNSVMVTNGGLIQWGDRRAFFIAGGQAGNNGSNASLNAFVVTDGGMAVGSGGTVSIGSGPGAWSNSFVVGRAALATNIGSVVVGAGLGAWGNHLVLDGGSLYASKVVADYPGNSVDFRGGLLLLSGTGSSFSNGEPLVVGDGAQPAVLDAEAACTVPLGITVASRATLAGLGPYHVTSGVTTVNGAVDPGRYPGATGSLVHNGAVTLRPGAVVRIDIGSTNRPGGYDRLVATNGTLTLGGTLKPVLASGFVPPASASFPYVVSNSVALAGAFDSGLADGSRVAAYSNDLTTVVGTFRVGVSNTFVVLDGFEEGARPEPLGALLIIR